MLFYSRWRIVKRSSDRTIATHGSERRLVNDREFILAAQDCVSTCKIVLPVIALFEAIMIVVQLVGVANGLVAAAVSPLYLVCYFVLLAASVVTYVYMRTHDVQEHARSISDATYGFSILMFVWAIFVTLIDATQGYQSPLIYGCVLLLLPLMGIMKKAHIVALELLGDIAVLIVCFSFYDDALVFLVNFVVYAVIALTLGLSYIGARENGHKREIELEELSDIRWQHANVDELTGMRNRRAYVGKLNAIKENPNRIELTLWLFDVNYLKVVNDEFGHAAGDDLLRGAAQCIEQSMGADASVYRIGGDEFAAIDLGCEDPVAVGARIEEACKAWKGSMATEMSIAYGSASSHDYPDASLLELEKRADAAMYADKDRKHAARA